MIARRPLPLWPLACFLAVLNFVAVAVGEREQYFAMFWTGVFAGQLGLFTVVSVFGGNWLRGYVESIAAQAIVAGGLLAGLAITNLQLWGGDEVYRAVLLLPLWVLIGQAPLLVLREAWGYQLIPSKMEGEPPVRPRQFGIGQVLRATAAVGVALGVARWSLPSEFSGDSTQFGRLLILSLVWGASSLVFGVPSVLAILSSRNPVARAVLVGACAFAVMLAVAAIGSVLTGKPGDTPEAFSVLGLTLAGGLCVLQVGLFVIRGRGYMLRRATGH